MHYLMEIFPIKQKTALPRSFTTVTKLLYINISYSLQSEILHRQSPSVEPLYPACLIIYVQIHVQRCSVIRTFSGYPCICIIQRDLPVRRCIICLSMFKKKQDQSKYNKCQTCDQVIHS